MLVPLIDEEKNYRKIDPISVTMANREDNPSIKSFRRLFGGAIHLLCIEDRHDLSSLLCEDIFASSLISAKPVHSFNDAKSAICSSRRHHIWLLDLTLNRHNDGIELLRLRNNFPFCVVFTGCCSVEDATEAMKAGAFGCFDKEKLFMKTINSFIHTVGVLAALSFSLKASRPSDWECFSILLNNFIRSPEEWARHYFKEARSVWNLCKNDSELTPKQFLHLFHAIQFVIISDCLIKDLPAYDNLTGLLEKRRDFYLESVDFVVKNSEKVYAPLFF